MGGYTTKSLPDPVADRFEELQPGEMTVGEFVTLLLDTYEADSVQETAEQAEDISKQVERLERRIKDLETSIPERTAREITSQLR